MHEQGTFAFSLQYKSYPENWAEGGVSIKGYHKVEILRRPMSKLIQIERRLEEEAISDW